MSADVLDTGSRAVYVSSLESAVCRERFQIQHFIYTSSNVTVSDEVCVCWLACLWFTSSLSLSRLFFLLKTGENYKHVFKYIKYIRKKKLMYSRCEIKFVDVLHSLKILIFSVQTNFTDHMSTMMMMTMMMKINAPHPVTIPVSVCRAALWTPETRCSWRSFHNRDRWNSKSVCL